MKLFKHCYGLKFIISFSFCWLFCVYMSVSLAVIICMEVWNMFDEYFPFLGVSISWHLFKLKLCLVHWLVGWLVDWLYVYILLLRPFLGITNCLEFVPVTSKILICCSYNLYTYVHVYNNKKTVSLEKRLNAQT